MNDPHRPADERSMWTFWNRVQNRYKFCDGGDDRRIVQARIAAYYATISFIDFHLGRVLHALDGDSDRTLVIFTSDHGELLGDYGCWGKRSMLNPSIRVPLIVRFPGKRFAGQQVDTPATLLDLAPTILSSAGVKNPQLHPEGIDLSDLASGAAPRDRIVYSQYQFGRYGLYMAEDRSGKYVRSSPDQKSWYLRGGDGASPERDMTADPSAAGQSRGLELALLRRFEADGYLDAVDEEGRWMRYDPVVFDESPDAGLLSQDPSQLRRMLDALPEGYVNPASEPVRGDPLRVIDPRAGSSGNRRPQPAVEVEVLAGAGAGGRVGENAPARSSDSA